MEFTRAILGAVVIRLLVTYAIGVGICIGAPMGSVTLRKRCSLSSGIAQL